MATGCKCQGEGGRCRIAEICVFWPTKLHRASIEDCSIGSRAKWSTRAELRTVPEYAQFRTTDRQPEHIFIAGRCMDARCMCVCWLWPQGSKNAASFRPTTILSGGTWRSRVSFPRPCMLETALVRWPRHETRCCDGRGCVQGRGHQTFLRAIDGPVSFPITS
jgi:hypothetical protein